MHGYKKLAAPKKQMDTHGLRCFLKKNQTVPSFLFVLSRPYQRPRPPCFNFCAWIFRSQAPEGRGGRRAAADELRYLHVGGRRGGGPHRPLLNADYRHRILLVENPAFATHQIFSPYKSCREVCVSHWFREKLLPLIQPLQRGRCG